MPDQIKRDLKTGAKFGDWTVIKHSGIVSHGHQLWVCRCSCGKEKPVSSYWLRCGRSLGCGCARYRRMAETNIIDRTGQRYGMLTVMERSQKRGRNGQIYWRCRCDCSRIIDVMSESLGQGRQISCGCKKRLPPGQYAMNTVIRVYKSQALARKLSWNLSAEEVLRLFNDVCAYCGANPGNCAQRTTGKFIYNGIDRVDNTRGYDPENCVSCCSQCNDAKGTLTVEQFREWVLRAAAKMRLP